jgi:MHS family proline/betaine transporter-like MFS transporter
VFNAVSFYVGFVYLVSWLQTADGMAPARALEINSVSMAVLLPVMIATGFLTDRIGRNPFCCSPAFSASSAPCRCSCC